MANIFLGAPSEKVAEYMFKSEGLFNNNEKIIAFWQKHYGKNPPLSDLPTLEKLTKMIYTDGTIESDIIGELKASDLGILYTDWNGIVEKLEDFDETKTPEEQDLPSVGSFLTTSYDMDEETTVPMRWQILGYNASIPEYVKYKDAEGNKIWISSLKNGLLTPIDSTSVVYEKKNDSYVPTTKQIGLVSGKFTYGNNCTYDVPKTITIDSATYTFAGYNMTLLSEYALSVKHENKLYTYAQFDNNRGENNWGQNDWSTSMLRSWMNGTGDMSRLADQIWRDYNWTYLTYGSSIYPLINRFEDNTFFENIVNTINRTWTYSSGNYDFRKDKVIDGNGCEHVSDKFWLLGIGNMNISGSNTNSYFKDQNYDTSKFSQVFSPAIDSWNNSFIRVRKYMNADGSEGSPCGWWLRSAGSSYSNYVGYVYYYGDVDSSYASNSYGVLAACTIG